jgi:nitrite reductase/ring-hydroxylating ferredoxin subunit
MTFLLNRDDIAEGATKSLDLSAEQSYFAVKRDGKIFVYRNQCPHLGVELNWQKDKFLDFDNTMIQCFTHGALFVIESGECLAGPCHGKYLESIPTVERDGAVFLEPLETGAVETDSVETID